MSNSGTQSAEKSNKGNEDKEDVTSGYNTGGLGSDRKRGEKKEVNRDRGQFETGELKSDKDVICQTLKRRRSMGDLAKRRQRMISYKSSQMSSTLCKRESDESGLQQESWGGRMCS
jgi:hypothetical protein